MSRAKIELSVLDKAWLTKEEAMSYLNRGEKTFDQEIRGRVNIYKGAGRQEIYKRTELDFIQGRMLIQKVNMKYESSKENYERSE